jgi:hypothetical protein
MVMALYSSSVLGREMVEKMCENLLSKYQNEEAFQVDRARGMTNKETLQERRDRILGTKRKYQLHVVLYTQEKKVNTNREDGILKQTPLPKVANTRKIRGMVQITHLNITVQAYSPRVF